MSLIMHHTVSRIGIVLKIANDIEYPPFSLSGFLVGSAWDATTR